jgi:hypothetical protein
VAVWLVPRKSEPSSLRFAAAVAPVGQIWGKVRYVVQRGVHGHWQ